MTQDRALFVLAVRIGEAIEVVNERPQIVADNAVGRGVCEARDFAEITVRAQCVRKLEQGLLALEADHAVQPRDVLDRFTIAEGRKMAANGEMTVDATVPKGPHQTREARQVELEDERKADDQWVARASNPQDLVPFGFEVENNHLITIPPQHCR